MLILVKKKENSTERDNQMKEALEANKGSFRGQLTGAIKEANRGHKQEDSFWRRAGAIWKWSEIILQSKRTKPGRPEGLNWSIKTKP